MLRTAVVVFFLTVNGGGVPPPDFIYWLKTACYIVLQYILCPQPQRKGELVAYPLIKKKNICPSTRAEGGRTTKHQQEKVCNTKARELFNDASREVNDARA
jgi:hypothetical protein